MSGTLLSITLLAACTLPVLGDDFSNYANPMLPTPPSFLPPFNPLDFYAHKMRQTNHSNCSVFERKEIHKCTEPMYEVGFFDTKENGDSFTWTKFFSQTRGYFQVICERFLAFDTCIEPYKANCFSDEPMRSKYETVVGIMEFTCHGGYQEMSKSFDCFSKTLTRAEMMQCQAEMMSDTNKINSKIPSNSMAQQEAVCGAMKNYVECIKYPVRYECGYRAWNDVKELIIGPAALVMPECDLNAGEYPRSSWLNLGMLVSTVIAKLWV